jgi:hypothetical protein
MWDMPRQASVELVSDNCVRESLKVSYCYLPKNNLNSIHLISGFDLIQNLIKSYFSNPFPIFSTPPGPVGDF